MTERDKTLPERTGHEYEGVDPDILRVRLNAELWGVDLDAPAEEAPLSLDEALAEQAAGRRVEWSAVEGFEPEDDAEEAVEAAEEAPEAPEEAEEGEDTAEAVEGAEEPAGEPTEGDAADEAGEADAGEAEEAPADDEPAAEGAEEGADDEGDDEGAEALDWSALNVADAQARIADATDEELQAALEDSRKGVREAAEAEVARRAAE